MSNNFDLDEAVAIVAASLYPASATFTSYQEDESWRKSWRKSWRNEHAKYNIIKGILTVYSAPERHYHGLAHVVAAIKTFEAGAKKASLSAYQVKLGILALLFHDVVYTTLYVPEVPDEVMSAKIAVSLINDLMPDNMIEDRCEADNVTDIISYLIQATGMHLKEKDFRNILGESLRSASPWGNRFDELTRLVMDADLSTLMTSAERAQQCWEDGVRQEYMLVPDRVYVPERLKVYKAFLDRDYVFRSAVFEECNKGALEMILTLGGKLLNTVKINSDIYNSIPEDVRKTFSPVPEAVIKAVVRPPIGS